MTSWRQYLLLIVLAGVATWLAVWPENYVAVLQAIKKPLRLTPTMRAGVDRVEAVFPSSNPWYARLIRLCGIGMWLVLLVLGYAVYKS